jgi:hypothetical protein
MAPWPSFGRQPTNISPMVFSGVRDDRQNVLPAVHNTGGEREAAERGVT